MSYEVISLQNNIGTFVRDRYAQIYQYFIL